MKKPVKVDLQSTAYTSCPFDHLQAMMDAGGIGRDDRIGALVVAGYDRVREIALDPKTFSSRRHGSLALRMGSSPDPVPAEAMATLSRAVEEEPALVSADAPAHTKQRRIMNLVFSPRRIAQLEPAIQAIGDDLIAAFADDEVDFIPSFAEPFPLRVIAHVLGVDYSIMPTVKRWADGIILGMSQSIDAEKRKEVAEAVVSLQEYFLPLIRDRRSTPGDDVLSEVIAATSPAGESLSDAELIPIVTQLMSAGHATTTHFITNAMVVLADDPVLYEHLRRRPDDVPSFLEEVLRHSPPVLASLRWTTGQTEVAGEPVDDQQLVVLMWGSACRDPNVFEEPEVFVWDRANARKHLAFGHGPHFCLGAGLARLEVDVALRLLLRRYARVETVWESSDFTPIPSFAQYGRRRIVLRLLGD